MIASDVKKTSVPSQGGIRKRTQLVKPTQTYNSGLTINTASQSETQNPFHKTSGQTEELIRQLQPSPAPSQEEIILEQLGSYEPGSVKTKRDIARDAIKELSDQELDDILSEIASGGLR